MVAKKPPDYVFIHFNDCRDVQDAICDLDGKRNWRVALSHNSWDDGDRGGHDRGGGRSDLKCLSVVSLVMLLVNAGCELVLEDLAVAAVIARVQVSIPICLPL